MTQGSIDWPASNRNAWPGSPRNQWPASAEYAIVDFLLAPVFLAAKGIRLLGVTMSTLDSIDAKAEPQLALPL